MKRHALLLVLVAMGTHHAAQAAVICAPGPNGSLVATSPGGGAPPTAEERQRCEGAASAAKTTQVKPDQAQALTHAADELARAARILADQANATQRKASAPEPRQTPDPVWILNAGESVDAGLQRWAKAASWTVVWGLPHDWLVPNGVRFQGDFASAAAQVIQSLASNGANIHADFYQGNRTLVVRSDSSSGEQH